MNKKEEDRVIYETVGTSNLSKVKAAINPELNAYHSNRTPVSRPLARPRSPPKA